MALIWKEYTEPNSMVEEWLKDADVKKFVNIDCFYDHYKAIINGANNIVDENGNVELEYIQGKNYFVYMIYDESELVGIIEIYNPLCVCTIIIAPKHRNKGLGTAILKDLIKDTQKYIPNPTSFDLGYIGAVIDNDNIASIKMFEKAGFEEKLIIDEKTKSYYCPKPLD